MTSHEIVCSYTEKQDYAGLKKYVTGLQFNDLINFINELPEDDTINVLDVMDDVIVLKCLKILPARLVHAVMCSMDHQKVARLLNAMPVDDRTSFFTDLPGRVVNELIRLLNEDERAATLQHLGYPENSVGRLMTPHYVAVKQDWTVKEVFDFIRHHGQNSETVNVIYVTDDRGVLIDDIRTSEFLFADSDKKVSDIMDSRFLSLLVTAQQEDAINMFRKNNRFALPVTDQQGVLLGIITIDDVLRLSETENTRDMQKMGGSEALDEPYTQISFLSLIKKRAGWLIILFIGEMFTATAMGHYEGEIQKAVVLSLFLPLIISSGGNSGSQASSIIIRSMALGEINFRSWWYVMRKEIFSGLTLGVILGAVGFIRVWTWQNLHWYNYGKNWIEVCFTVFFALIGVVLWGTLAGSMLPLLLKKLGADPAASSAPFVATLVDVTGLVIYFSIALVVMKGTLT